MAIILRGLASIAGGSAFYAILLFVAFRLVVSGFPPFTIIRILLWNVHLFGFLGRAEPVGYMPDGAPIYDGSVGLGGMTWESILTGFVIYPVLIFIILSIITRLRSTPRSGN